MDGILYMAPWTLMLIPMIISAIFVFYVPFIPENFETAVIIWAITLILIVVLFPIFAGDGIAIHMKNKEVGGFRHTLFNNIFWGIPKVSWYGIGKIKSVLLHRDFIPDYAEGWDTYHWKLNLETDSTIYELKKFVEKDISGVMTEVSYLISHYMEIPFYDEKGDTKLNLTHRLYPEFRTEQDLVQDDYVNSSEDNKLKIEGKKFSHSFSMYVFDFFFLVIAISVLIFSIFDPKNFLIYFLMSLLFMSGFIATYRGLGHYYEIIVKEDILQVRRYRKYYFDNVVNVALGNILSIDNNLSSIEIIHTEGREEFSLLLEEEETVLSINQVKQAIQAQIPK